MAYITVDVELSEIDTRYLLEELENRCLDDNEKRGLLDSIKSNYWESDNGKWELFLKIKDKYSLFELQEMFKDKRPIEVSKNQLSLSLNS